MVETSGYQSSDTNTNTGLPYEEAALQPCSAVGRRQGKADLSCIIAETVLGMFWRAGCPALPALQIVSATASGVLWLD